VAASVIVIDLDHFKRIDDQRGHDTGDGVLRTLGEILRASTRNTDAVRRWGGEEFVLVCPGASLARAADLAEKLRHKIMETNFVPEDPLPITASFGVATSTDAQGFEDAFRQADQSLYLAKSRGRNCVVAANEGEMHKVTGASKGTWALVSGRFKLHQSRERLASGRHAGAVSTGIQPRSPCRDCRCDLRRYHGRRCLRVPRQLRVRGRCHTSKALSQSCRRDSDSAR
jgi:diguanylate cyclase (GGDEF)-like protein